MHPQHKLLNNYWVKDMYQTKVVEKNETDVFSLRISNRE